MVKLIVQGVTIRSYERAHNGLALAFREARNLSLKLPNTPVKVRDGNLLTVYCNGRLY